MSELNHIEKIKRAHSSGGAVVCTKCRVEINLADCDSVDDALAKWDNHVEVEHR